MIAEEDGAITEIRMDERIPSKAQKLRTPLLDRAYCEIRQYLAGQRRQFTIPLCPKGTPFQQTVWRELEKIPYGQTRSYSEIAAEIGHPKAARAVGMANHINPILLAIPCHRVIGKNGDLTGYYAGLDVKRKLLELEKQWSDRY